MAFGAEAAAEAAEFAEMAELAQAAELAGVGAGTAGGLGTIATAVLATVGALVLASVILGVLGISLGVGLGVGLKKKKTTTTAKTTTSTTTTSTSTTTTTTTTTAGSQTVVSAAATNSSANTTASSNSNNSGGSTAAGTTNSGGNNATSADQATTAAGTTAGSLTNGATTQSGGGATTAAAGATTAAAGGTTAAAGATTASSAAGATTASSGAVTTNANAVTSTQAVTATTSPVCNSTQYAKAGACLPKVTFGVACTATGGECQDYNGLNCSTTLTCACNSTTFFNVTKCTTYLEFNDTCTGDGQCNANKGLTCQTSGSAKKCLSICGSASYYDTTTSKCVTKVDFGIACTTNTMCKGVYVCLNNGVLSAKVTGTTTVATKTAISIPAGSATSGAICLCPIGTYRDGAAGNCITAVTAFGGTCGPTATDKQCDPMTNMTCLGTTCGCIDVMFSQSQTSGCFLKAAADTAAACATAAAAANGVLDTSVANTFVGLCAAVGAPTLNTDKTKYYGNAITGTEVANTQGLAAVYTLQALQAVGDLLYRLGPNAGAVFAPAFYPNTLQCPTNAAAMLLQYSMGANPGTAAANFPIIQCMCTSGYYVSGTGTTATCVKAITYNAACASNNCDFTLGLTCSSTTSLCACEYGSWDATKSNCTVFKLYA